MEIRSHSFKRTNLRKRFEFRFPIRKFADFAKNQDVKGENSITNEKKVVNGVDGFLLLGYNNKE